MSSPLRQRSIHERVSFKNVVTFTSKEQSRKSEHKKVSRFRKVLELDENQLILFSNMNDSSQT